MSCADGSEGGFHLRMQIDGALLEALHKPAPPMGRIMGAIIGLSSTLPIMVSAVIFGIVACGVALYAGVTAPLAFTMIGAAAGALGGGAMASALQRLHRAIWGASPRQVAIGDELFAQFGPTGITNDWAGLVSTVPWSHVTSIHVRVGYAYLHTTLGVTFVFPLQLMSVAPDDAVAQMRKWKEAA